MEIACLCCTMFAVRVHLITAESPESRRLRYGRLIQFPQLTMPLIAALTPTEHEVSHTDEIVDPVRLDVPADRITAPTPSALHAYKLAGEFRRRGVPVVIGGPHATALPEEAERHAEVGSPSHCQMSNVPCRMSNEVVKLPTDPIGSVGQWVI
jgi:hypothetical protein